MSKGRCVREERVRGGGDGVREGGEGEISSRKSSK